MNIKINIFGKKCPKCETDMDNVFIYVCGKWYWRCPECRYNEVDKEVKP